MDSDTGEIEEGNGAEETVEEYEAEENGAEEAVDEYGAADMSYLEIEMLSDDPQSPSNSQAVPSTSTSAQAGLSTPMSARALYTPKPQRLATIKNLKKQEKCKQADIDRMFLKHLSAPKEIPDANAFFLKELGQLLNNLPQIVQMETKIEIQQLVLNKFKDTSNKK